VTVAKDSEAFVKRRLARAILLVKTGIPRKLPGLVGPEELESGKVAAYRLVKPPRITEIVMAKL
jgi:hypothetical protein